MIFGVVVVVVVVLFQENIQGSVLADGHLRKEAAGQRDEGATLYSVKNNDRHDD